MSVHVPRLSVDVTFKKVLKGPYGGYNSHVKSLLEDLQEAVSIAQQHTFKEQQRQAREYNKRTHGTFLSEGDRVLLANKGEGSL